MVAADGVCCCSPPLWPVVDGQTHSLRSRHALCVESFVLSVLQRLVSVSLSPDALDWRIWRIAEETAGLLGVPRDVAA